jgi:DNA-binding transcriptional MocR family regulator
MPEFSQSARRMRTSEIRDLMKHAANPALVSFAGGMPNNELFPTDEIDEVYESLPIELKRQGFQYGPTAGFPPLLEELSNYLRAKGLPVDSNKLMITTGSLQAINITAKVFVDPADPILTEYPTFIGAAAAFQSYQANAVGVEMDADGVVPEKLERAYRDHPTAKFLYLMPYFHNPAGVLYSAERKAFVKEFVAKNDILLLEDDPYGELYFHEEDLPLTVPLKCDPEIDGKIAYVGSFSKILGPGTRLGWALVPPDIYPKYELAKQSLDACSSTFTQVLASEFLRQGKLPGYLARLREIYHRRMRSMIDAMNETMPEEASWVEPRGGFYVWIELPERVNALDVLETSIENGAVFVVGKAFDPKGERNNCLRLAYSHTPEDRLAAGVKIVAEAIKRAL